MEEPRSYFRIMLGPKSVYAQECFDGGFIGGDWAIDLDLSNRLPENWREFNREFIPVYLAKNPDKSKVAAGLACGMLYTICKGMRVGDIVLSPDGTGNYRAGEVTSEYIWNSGANLPHRRQVHWFARSIARDRMSQELKNSSGSIGTVSDLSKHATELRMLLEGGNEIQPFVLGETLDQTAFALERHLEDFLVQNWQSTELGSKYDLLEIDGDLIGQQYPTDTGPIDILAVSKDKTELLVIELKKGRASDSVVGQIQRYMGYVADELAEASQTVRGIIIALDDDLRTRRALSVATNIEFYRYKVDFKLYKVREQ